MNVKTKLKGVEETLLIPLWGRAAETRRLGGIVNDPRAVELVDAIDYNFTKLAWDWTAQLGVAIRTEILDQATLVFLAKHPDALVLNLASGLDTRFYRLDNGQLEWVDVDLPDSMALRRTFFNDEERHRYVTGTVLDDTWCLEIPRAPGQAVLVIIEGLLMYLTPDETRELLIRLANFFPGAEVLMEAISPTVVKKGDWFFRARGMSARFKGGLESGRDVEAWDPRLHFVEEWYYMDRHAWRWGVLAIGRLIGPWRTFMKIAHVRID